MNSQAGTVAAPLLVPIVVEPGRAPVTTTGWQPPQSDRREAAASVCSADNARTGAVLPSAQRRVELGGAAPATGPAATICPDIAAALLLSPTAGSHCPSWPTSIGPTRK